MRPVFTPLNQDRTERLEIKLDDIEVISGGHKLLERGRGKKAVIRFAGKTYQVYGISCGLPGCACDSYIKEIA